MCKVVTLIMQIILCLFNFITVYNNKNGDKNDLRA